MTIVLQGSQQNNSQQAAAPAPRKNILAKAAIFNNNVQQEPVVSLSEHVPKQLDRNKTAFLTQTTEKQTVSAVSAAEEINQLKQKAATEVVPSEEVT